MINTARLSLHAHNGISGITRTSDDEDSYGAINHFLKSRFPGKTWTSIAILCNPKMELHRDLMNLKGHMNRSYARFILRRTRLG